MPTTVFRNTSGINNYMEIDKSFEVLDRWLEFQFGADADNFVKLLGKFLDWETKKYNCIYIADPASAGKSLVYLLLKQIARHFKHKPNSV